MKKAAVIFLVFIYALSTTGFALKANYCCDRLTSVKVILASDVKDKAGCCGVKYQSFKIKDSHSASDVVTAPALHYSFIHTFNSGFEINDISFQKSNQPVSIHAPPLYSITPIYISNCVFRI